MTYVSGHDFQFEVNQIPSEDGYPWVVDIGTPRIAAEIPASTGDVLVAVVHAMRTRRTSESGTLTWSEMLTWPTGWQTDPSWHWSVTPNGNPDIKDGAIWVAWHRVASGGTWTGTFSLAGMFDRDPAAYEWERPRAAHLHVMRFSGMLGVRGLVGRESSSWTFPAVPHTGPMPSEGHALRIAGMGRYGGFPSPFGPSAHTKRVDMTLGGITLPAPSSLNSLEGGFGVWEAALSSAAPAAVAAGGGSQRGVQISIFVASAAPPSAPSITSPPNGQAGDYTQPFRLSWAPALPQDGVQVTRQQVDAGGSPTGTLEYLTSVSSPAWSSSATTLSTAVTTVDLPGGFTAGGQRWKITVKTRTPGSASLGDAASTTIRSFLPPTASNPHIVAGQVDGSTITSRTPWVRTDGAAGAGATITLREVAVVDATTGQVYSQGEYGAPYWWPVPNEEALPQGAVVVVRGRVQQSWSQWSEWVESSPLTVSTPRPPAPTITDSGTSTHPVSGLPGAVITVVSSVTGDLTLYRDGVAAGVWPVEASTPLVIGDYAGGGLTTYTASVSAVMSGLPETSPLSDPHQVTLDLDDAHCWLIDPMHPEDAIRAHCVDYTLAHPRPSTVFRPLSSAAPVSAIVQSLPVQTPTGTLTVSTNTAAEEAAVVRMLTSGRPLVYLRWVEHAPLSGGSAPLGPLRFIPVGTVTPERVASGPSSWRHITVEWVSSE